METPWLLCNKCFVLWDEAAANLYLTQCGHVFCRICVSRLSGTCPVCNANGVRTMPIASPISPIIAPLFADMEKTVEDSVMRAKFQESQSTVLANRELYLEAKYGKLKTAYGEVLDDMRKIHQNFHRLKEYYIQLRNSRAQAAASNVSPRNRRVNFSNQNVFFGANDRNPNALHSSRVDSGDSDASGSTIRAGGAPTTRDGLFRIPTAARIPRSVGTPSESSRVSTPMSDWNQSSGYGSGSKAYRR